MDLLTDAPEQRTFTLHGIERGREPVFGEIGKADNGVRETMLVGNCLHPGDFLDGARGRPVGLHVNRGDDAGIFDVVEIFADRVVAPDRLVGPENARHHGPVQPGLVRLAPNVMMGVDDIEGGHGESEVSS